MSGVSKDLERRPHTESAADLAGLLQPGVLVVESENRVIAAADPRALELLGCVDRPDLESCWQALSAGLREAGALGPESARTILEAPGAEGGVPGQRRLSFDWRPHAAGGVLLVHDAAVTESWAADLQHASLLRSVSQITPAVAHDLRAPINAMVFNIEVLKETIAGGSGTGDPKMRDRQLRYVHVLHEELHRLHQGLETYLAQLSPRGDREETFDLRDPLGELAALLVGPARKQQARVAPELPDEAVQVTGNRFLIRQALLHVAVAALAGVSRDGALKIQLERRNGRAWIRFSGGGDGREPEFGIAASPQGTQAQLWTARSILSDLGGAVRAWESTTGAPGAYEVELDVTQQSGTREKE